MKKIIIGIIVLLVSIKNIAAQGEKLFLIAGQGYPWNCKAEDLKYDQTYPVHLFELHNDSLKLYKTLAYNQNVNRIALFSYFKMAIIYKSEVSNREFKFTILKISYSNKFKIDSIERNFSISVYFGDIYYLIDLKDEWIVIEYYPDIYLKSEAIYYYGINLKTGKDSLFNNQIIKYLHSEGEQGCITSNKSDILEIGTKLNKQSIINYVKEPRLYTPDTCIISFSNYKQLINHYKYIAIPDKSPNDYIPIPIYNKKNILINSGGNWNEYKAQSNFEIYTLIDSSWKTTILPVRSSKHGIRTFNNWLAGYACYSYSNEYPLLISKYGSIPGKKYRPVKSFYGATFDERAEYIKIFLEGKLFIFNILTNKYIEWEALENGERQGDSEILLVQDEMVYYRINDKIYQAPIINGEKLGDSKLLVQDPRVPDIHWAFIAGN